MADIKPIVERRNWPRRILNNISNGRRLRIYIMPTWYCVFFAILLLCMIGYGFSLKSPSMIGTGVLIVFIQLLSMVESHVNIRELDLSFVSCVPAEADSMGEFKIRVASKNKSWGVKLYLKSTRNSAKVDVQKPNKKSVDSHFKYEIRQALKIGSAGEDKTQEHDIGTNDTDYPLVFTASSRGIHPIPVIVASSLFPFGMFRVWREFDVSATYAAYPHPIGEAIRASDAGDTGSISGEAEASKLSVGAESEYAFHRNFTVGDPLNRIDWRASSRRGVKIVKVFEGSRVGQGRTLRWSDTKSKDPERRLEELSYWVNLSSRDHIPYRLELPSGITSFGTGDAHKYLCLTNLAAFDAVHWADAALSKHSPQDKNDVILREVTT